MTYLIVGLVILALGLLIAKVNAQFGDGLVILGAIITLLAGAAILLHVLPRT